MSNCLKPERKEMNLSEEFKKKIAVYLNEKVYGMEWSVDLIHTTLKEIKEMVSKTYPNAEVVYAPLKSDGSSEYDVFSILVMISNNHGDILNVYRFSIEPPPFDPMIEIDYSDDKLENPKE